MPTTPPPPQKRDKKLEAKVEDDLYEDAHAYAHEHGVSVGAIIRWFFKKITRTSGPWMLTEKEIQEIKDQEKKRAPGGGRKPKPKP